MDAALNTNATVARVQTYYDFTTAQSRWKHIPDVTFSLTGATNAQVEAQWADIAANQLPPQSSFSALFSLYFPRLTHSA